MTSHRAALLFAALLLAPALARAEAPTASPAKTEAKPLPPPGIVDGATAQQLQARGVTVVDVRTPQEFADGHVPGARNIPVDQVAARAGEIGAKDRPVLLYCRTGRRSGMAAAELQRQGFTVIYDFKSMSAWPGPVEQGAAK